MNDRAVSVLEEYDLEVLRTWKGRGAILFDTREGICILKEYTGIPERLISQDKLLTYIKEQGDFFVETIVPNKEGSLWTKDQDQTTYIVKTYPQGRECGIRDVQECERAMERLAGLHLRMRTPVGTVYPALKALPLDREYEKHNRELKRVRKFLRNKSQKSEFEIYLLQHYDSFMEKAFAVSKDWAAYCSTLEKPSDSQWESWCHGDFQHHNLITANHDVHVINFEKCVVDSQIRDLSLFFRKFMEKSDWSPSAGERLLEAYDRKKPLGREDKARLYYRLLYPEKFRKIVNFYYNTGKSWLPGKNTEKLEKLLRQEDDRERFLQKLFP